MRHEAIVATCERVRARRVAHLARRAETRRRRQLRTQAEKQRRERRRAARALEHAPDAVRAVFRDSGADLRRLIVEQARDDRRAFVKHGPAFLEWAHSA